MEFVSTAKECGLGLKADNRELGVTYPGTGTGLMYQENKDTAQISGREPDIRS